jgi:predicted GIY-YIG superfamily endonuclease
METNKRWIYVLKDPRDDSYKYVGMSKNPNKRLKEHIYDCKRETTKKGNWISKLVMLGLEPILVILEETTIDECGNREEYHIKNLINEGSFLLNYDDKGVGTANGLKKETIDKLKSFNTKQIIRYDLNGIKIDEFKSLREAARLTGLNHGNISKCCSGKFKHTGGFIFKTGGTNIDVVMNPNGVKKNILEVDNEGNIINEFISISEASKQTMIAGSSISRACHGKIKKTNNRYFKFKNNE